MADAEGADRPAGAGARLAAGLVGALGFLTRLPVAVSGRHHRAFATTPLAFPAAGYVVGLVATLPVVLAGALALPAPVAVAGYLVAVYLLTGPSHADGLADLGDAVAVHGHPARRREVMTDTTVGVGGALAVAVGVAALALGALGAAGLPPLYAAGLVLAAEVGAKLSMAAVACLGTAAHEGLGSQFTREASPALLAGPVAVALPAALLTVPSPAGLVALLCGFGVGAGLVRWARARLGGVSGDVFGAANELGRTAALHGGVVAWTLS